MKTLIQILALFALLTFSSRADTGAVGAKFVLTATSDGDAPITFEWFKGAEKVADGATFTIDKLALTDAGTYTVKASNKFGSSVSPEYVLEVGNPPSAPKIIRTLVSTTVDRHSTVKLEIVADGAAPIEYQWKHGTSIVQGAKSPFVMLYQVQKRDGGFWAVTARNAFGGATSDMVLTVR